jgi:hypothetical protein
LCLTAWANYDFKYAVKGEKVDTWNMTVKHKARYAADWFGVNTGGIA